MAKLSKRQKFLREKRSSNSNSWGFSESQLDQLESMYGKGIKQFYEIEKTPPQQLSSKRKNFLSMTGKLSDYSSARLGGGGGCGILVSHNRGTAGVSPISGLTNHQSSNNRDLYWYPNPSSANNIGTLIIPVTDYGEVARYDNKIWVSFQGGKGIKEWDFNETTLTASLTASYYYILDENDGGLCSINATTFVVGSKYGNSICRHDPALSGGGVRIKKVDLSSGSPIITTVFQTHLMCLARDIVYIPSSDSYVLVGIAPNDPSKPSYCNSSDIVRHFDSSGNLLGTAWFCDIPGTSWYDGVSTFPLIPYILPGGPFFTGAHARSYSTACYDGKIYISASGPGNMRLNDLPFEHALFELDLQTMTLSYSITANSDYYPTTGTWSDAASNPECCDGAYVVPTWECDGLGNCYDPGTGAGQYSVANGYPNPLQACEDICFPPTWRCTNTNQGCLPNPLNTDPAIYGSNVYYSLQDCENNCYIKRWTCTGRQFAQLNCVMSSHLANAVPSGPGIYSSPGACNANCNQTTWNCTLTGCIDPGDQSGQYFHLNECEDECTVYQCQNLASQGPSSGNIPGCVPFQGGQVTLNAGLSAGQLWYNNISDCQANCYNPSWNCKFDPGQVQQLPTWNCVDPLDGSGSFSSLVDCQNNCGPDPIRGKGYNCDDVNGCVPHTGTGMGQYPTLAACQVACPFPSPPPSLRPMPPPREPSDTGY